MPYEIDIVDAEPILTAVIRDRVPLRERPKFVPAACGEVWTFARSAGLPKPRRRLALYLDQQGAIEVGAEVTAPFAGNERIHCSQLPAGRTAHTIHFGPYQRLGDAHTAIQKWCDQHGSRRTGVCWELYGHWLDEWNSDPSQIRTDVYYLLIE